MFRDNTPVICLGMWPLTADYMEEDYMSGLLPTLYSEDPQASTAALLADPARARKDLENLNRVFFMLETISLVEALRVVKKPRNAEAEFTYRLQNLERLSEPHQSLSQGIHFCALSAPK